MMRHVIITTTAGTIYWPVWQDDTTTCATTCTPSSTAFAFSNTTSATPVSSSSAIYWPVWHDVEMPAVILPSRRMGFPPQAGEEQEKRARANECAKQILLDHLTPQQRETVEKNGWFTIQGGETGKLYRVGTRGFAGNVEELDADGKPVARLCCHLSDALPHHDHHLAQKLMLEWEEQTFLELANRTAMAR
jgi:hypothetical protein